MVVVSQLRNPHALSGLLRIAKNRGFVCLCVRLVNAVRKGTSETHKALWRSFIQTPANARIRFGQSDNLKSGSRAGAGATECFSTLVVPKSPNPCARTFITLIFPRLPRECPVCLVGSPVPMSPNPRARTRRTLSPTRLPCILPARAVCSRGSFAGWGVVPGLGRAGLAFFLGCLPTP